MEFLRLKKVVGRGTHGESSTQDGTLSKSRNQAKNITLNLHRMEFLWLEKGGLKVGFELFYTARNSIDGATPTKTVHFWHDRKQTLGLSPTPSCS
jgi:hypothetical protein